MTDPRPKYRCPVCGFDSRYFAAAERHVDGEHGGGRIELLYETKGAK